MTDKSNPIDDASSCLFAARAVAGTDVELLYIARARFCVIEAEQAIKQTKLLLEARERELQRIERQKVEDAKATGPAPKKGAA